MREELRELEDGGIYRHLGIKNFLEGDLFSWYLDAWNEDVEKIIRQMVAVLDEYDPKTLSIDPIESRDLLKKLYQQLFPKTVRHDLGEYYTPDWLAELVIERVGYDGDPNKRVLDPACGSGTFLVMAINKVREYADKHLIPKHQLLPKILDNIIGFDLNPLAVMAARTNYLLALRELLKLGGEIEIPIYLCDSIMTPAEYGELVTKEGTVTGGVGKVQELKTSAARFMIPTEIAQSRRTMAAYTEELEHCIRHDYAEDEFIHRLEGDRLPVENAELHKTLYNQILKLKKQNQNDIWARIIKNSFAPLFIERVDYVIGNPPWINWESLPEDYRQSTAHLWDRYDLRPEKGQLDRMRGGKKDLSMLFVYVGMDDYLSKNGTLGFVITQTVFKTTGAGDGFRRFRYPAPGGQTAYVAPTLAIDLSDLQPFEGATNRTGVLTCQNSEKPVSYPVPYEVWSKKNKQSIVEGDTLTTVLPKVRLTELVASPVSSKSDTAPWLTVPATVLQGVKKILGSSAYIAREGVNTGGLNGCYWLQILKKLSTAEVLIENLHDIGKNKLKRVQMAVEVTHLYPLLRGRDVSKWHAASSAYLLAPQDGKNQREGIPETILKRESPKTYSYLKKFEKELSARADRKYYPQGSPFYTMRNMAPYSLMPWKVVFREQATSLTTAVVGPSKGEFLNGKPIVSDHKLMITPLERIEEAHFLCAVLNSSLCRLLVASYCIDTAISTHVLQFIKIPKFDSGDRLHVKLSNVSQKAHEAKLRSNDKELAKIESELDLLAAELWGLTAKELERIQKSVNEQ